MQNPHNRAAIGLLKNISRDNAAIVALCLIYTLAVTGVIYFVIRQPELVQIYFFNRYVFILGIVFSTLLIALNMILRQHKAFLQARSIAGFFIILLLLPLYVTTFASYKQAIPYLTAFAWDQHLMTLDRLIHFNLHPWELFSFVLQNESMLLFIDKMYMTWFVLLFLFCLWMGWSQRRSLRKRFFITTILVWCIFGSVFGTLFFSAGPCYYEQVVEGPNPFIPLMERLHTVHEEHFLWAVHNQTGLWNAKLEGKWLPFGGISAMPSVHVAMAMVFALTLLAVHPILGVLGFLYVILIQMGSVVLGWHYAVDGYVSVVLTLMVWKVLSRFNVPQTEKHQ